MSYISCQIYPFMIFIHLFSITAVTCAPLTAPKGGFLIPKKCSNTYGSKCSFYCREGYCPFSCSAYDVVRPNKTHILLPDRTCLETRKWSKDEFICESKFLFLLCLLKQPLVPNIIL